MNTRFWLIGAPVLTLGVTLGATTLLENPQDAKARTEAMQKWKALGTPGENHKLLQPLVGKWNVKVTMHEDPNAPAQESTATSDFVWIYDGRFLEESVSGSMGDSPFVGRAIHGYDNFGKKFVCTWMDNTSTSIIVSQGTYDSASKEFRMTSECPDPKSGKYVPGRNVIKSSGNDHWTSRMYKTGADGKEYLAAELDYTRMQ